MHVNFNFWINYGPIDFIMKAVTSQIWDASFSIQALLASNLIEELGPTLMKAHDFLKKCQVYSPSNSINISSSLLLFIAPNFLQLKIANEN